MGERSLVVGVRWSFRGKDAGSADSSAIEATEDAASGRAARPDGQRSFHQTLAKEAGAGGFEPPITGPKPAALPLGYAPVLDEV